MLLHLKEAYLKVFFQFYHFSYRSDKAIPAMRIDGDASSLKLVQEKICV